MFVVVGQKTHGTRYSQLACSVIVVRAYVRTCVYVHVHATTKEGYDRNSIVLLHGHHNFCVETGKRLGFISRVWFLTRAQHICKPGVCWISGMDTCCKPPHCNRLLMLSPPHLAIAFPVPLIMLVLAWPQARSSSRYFPALAWPQVCSVVEQIL